MDNIKPLSKMPFEVSNTLSKYFLENSITYERWTPDHYAYQILLDKRRELRKLFPLRPKDIHLYKITPDSRMLPHLDRGRNACLQIPCNIDSGFKTFSQKDNVELSAAAYGSHRPAKDNETIVTMPTGPLFFQYEEEKFDTYVTDLPYLQNAAKAHGGINETTNVDRYFWSLSYVEDFDYVCDAFREWM